MKLSTLVTSGILGASLIAGTALTALPASAGVLACSGSACDGLDPQGNCSGDARTVDSLTLGQAILELRYSRACRATWARISNAPWVVNDTFASFARVVRNSDGRTYSCTVPRDGTSCYTRMVNDANVTSYAYGEWDSGARVYSGRTGSYL
ncbi:DUF2690 domain-containing protein [Sphaerisporangium aureirubrum]|uniref:DUF2690 domain-containing protein n=1 Tax=Sphaerisporangium aureirubrum TaxID=1544736 RepID=A0ABW1NDD0_9ACTN